MNGKILAFIVTHGDLGCSLAKVAEKLMMPSHNLHCYSNQTLTSDEIVRKINEKIENEKPARVVVFVDLMGGSCWVIGSRVKHTHAQTTVVSGVNVPMLVSFFVNSQRLAWEELLEKITGDAKKGIVVR